MDCAIGELFFAGGLFEQSMGDMEIYRMNRAFRRGLFRDSEDALRAYYSKADRLVSDGRFDVQREGDVFAE